MGGMCNFTNCKLAVSVGDFHKSIIFMDHNYRMDILDDTRVVFSAPVAINKTCQDKVAVEECNFVVDVNENAKFYRVEIFDENKNLRIAIGNPIWNEKFYK